MNILFVAPLVSKQRIRLLFEQTGKDPGFAIMRLNRLLAEGFAKNNDKISVLSPHTASRKRTWLRLKENVEGVTYHYEPIVNKPLIKNICQFLYSFIYVLFWGLYKRSNKAVVCDVLTLSASLGSLLASKINGLRIVAIVTDVPNHNWSGVSTRSGDLCLWMIEKMDGYVLLTEQMNEVVNFHKRPYIVMEGVVECESLDQARFKKSDVKVIMYAGGMNRINGVDILAQAVCELPNDNIRLDLYGDGNLKEKMIELSNKDHRINYCGMKMGDYILEAERKASLLVNPRPLNGEYIKYSFPSKNLEYMQSGTPLLTTPLPCIPEDHKPFLFFLPAQASVEGYRESLKNVMGLSEEELEEKGKKAREFVLREKNNAIQAKRIVELIKTI